MIILKDLDKNHPLRNQPLKGMFYLSKGSNIPNEVKDSYGISKKTYNDLGSSWTDHDTFFFKDS